MAKKTTPLSDTEVKTLNHKAKSIPSMMVMD